MGKGQQIAVIAHITIIGWIIAVVMNGNERDEFASFYIRQLLGLFALGLVGAFIPIVKIIIGIVVLVLVIMSLIGAVNNEKQLTPVIGEYFQDWFKSL